MQGFVSYSTKDGAGAEYPGLESNLERATQDLEGFSRIAPLLAVWLNASSTDTVTLPSGKTINIADLLKQGLVTGCDPASPDYWGDIHDKDQRIVEAADIALSVWLTRQKLWVAMSERDRSNIATWLARVNGKDVADNNWHLFIAQVNVVLESLGEPFSDSEIHRRLGRIRSFYVGDGWFTDGPAGPYDLYNAWAFQYHLHWIDQIHPNLVSDLVNESLPPFSRQLLHLIGPHGLPVYGRSVCYRMAVAAPPLFATQLKQNAVTAGEAKRALDATWRFFLNHGAVKQGRVTQGYCGDDGAVLDGYSGPASCLWSLRSLIAALSLPADSPVWVDGNDLLPVERSDFKIALGPTGLIALGSHASGDIVIQTTAAPNGSQPVSGSQPVLSPYTLRERALDVLLGGSRRPENKLSKYHRREYGAAHPFCGCPS